MIWTLWVHVTIDHRLMGMTTAIPFSEGSLLQGPKLRILFSKLFQDSTDKKFEGLTPFSSINPIKLVWLFWRDVRLKQTLSAAWNSRFSNLSAHLYWASGWLSNSACENYWIFDHRVTLGRGGDVGVCWSEAVRLCAASSVWKKSRFPPAISAKVPSPWKWLGQSWAREPKGTNNISQDYSREL